MALVSSIQRIKALAFLLRWRLRCHDGFATVLPAGLVAQFYIVGGGIGGVVVLDCVTNTVGIEADWYRLDLSPANHARAGDYQYMHAGIVAVIIIFCNHCFRNYSNTIYDDADESGNHNQTNGSQGLFQYPF